MTRPNWIRQAVLAALLFGLAMTAYWLEFKHKPAEEAKEEQTKKIFTLKEVPTEHVKIVDGKKVVELDCLDASAKLCKPGDNSKWEITEPLKLKADDANANSLLSTLNNLSVTESIDLKEETPEKKQALLKEYGLDLDKRQNPDTRRIEVTGPNGGVVLYLGLTHPIGEAIFGVVEHVASGQKPSGKVEENTVYLVPTYFKTNFDHDLTYWRDKKLLTVAAHEVDSFKLSSAKGTIEATRKDGQWILHSQGQDYAGDLENIDSLLSGASYLVAKEFIAADKNSAAAKEALKGTKPVMTFTIQPEAKAGQSAKDPKETALPPPVSLTFFQKPEKAPKKPADPKAPPPPSKEKLFATVSNVDPLFELDPVQLVRYEKEVKELRMSKLLTSMDRFSAKKIEFSGKPIGDQPLVLTNVDGKWKSAPLTATTVPADQQNIDDGKVADLLDKLSGNRIKSFLSGKDVPSGEDEGLLVTVYADKPEPRRKLAFWKKGDDLYARDLMSERKEVFGVDGAVTKALPWDKIAFFKVAPPVPNLSAVPPNSSQAPAAPKGNK